MTTIVHETFGPLQFKEGIGWAGWILLPHFAKCHDRNIDPPTVAQGQRFPLLLPDPHGDGPTEAQEAAFAFLMAAEAEVLEDVLEQILQQYGNPGYWTLDGFVPQRPDVEVKSKKHLKKRLQLEAICFEQESNPELTTLHFEFSSSLDEEHGIEVDIAFAGVEDPDSEEELKAAVEALDPFSDQPILAFPFPLPANVDLSTIPPSEDGHRFVELKYGGRWSGIFVINADRECVATIVDSRPRPLHDPAEIEAARAPSPLRRWLADPERARRLLYLAAANNLLIALPCLLIGWLYNPWLLGLCSGLSLSSLAIYSAIRRTGTFHVGLATSNLVLSVAGLIYAGRVDDFGSPEHVAAVTGFWGTLLWWGTCLVAGVNSLFVLFSLIGLLRRSFEGGLSAAATFLVPAAFSLTILVLGLLATSSGNWSALHLLWITPTTLLAGLLMFLLCLVLLPGGETKTPPACPHCGAALEAADAMHCEQCGEDWYPDPLDPD